MPLQDLKQFKDRDEWYIARFAANDAPDFNPGTFLASKDAALDLRTVSVAAEISRESVPLRNAYMHVGQKCSIRVNNGPIRELTGAPFADQHDTRRHHSSKRQNKIFRYASHDCNQAYLPDFVIYAFCSVLASNKNPASSMWLSGPQSD